MLFVKQLIKHQKKLNFLLRKDQLTLCYHDLNVTLKWASPDIYKLEIEQGNIINLEHVVYGKNDIAKM